LEKGVFPKFSPSKGWNLKRGEFGTFLKGGAFPWGIFPKNPKGNCFGLLPGWKFLSTSKVGQNCWGGFYSWIPISPFLEDYYLSWFLVKLKFKKP